jgi:hypothetical protein
MRNKFAILYRSLVLGNTFLRVMETDILPGAKNCSENDTKAAVGRISQKE